MESNEETNSVVKVIEFTSVPGARYRKDGDGSAQAFFEDHLKPILDGHIPKRLSVLIDFDGTWGYASSFISELARRIALDYKEEDIEKYLLLKSDDEPTLIDRLWNELRKDYDGQTEDQ